MNEFDEIGKMMPYNEKDDYLDGLINTATEKAIRQAKPLSRKRFTIIVLSAAASIIMALGVGGMIWLSGESPSSRAYQSVSPIDEFLNSLSDEEIAALPYYEIEEIPEY